ncbi:MAG: fumarylacetoacetate hydrolase family protein [Planctomycetes bacterium]|nr:fumarylacetoacetate hydrolase family protein [Planctomycetota bacterium]MCH9725176.1 fumarylacetoacetate hydrolase family protein [Planctomycetota bacterium]MCH9776586.1 fumarylacetoacetate hydrolase family protein [Planctomycetota bacterium]MCH9792479.1 fumarylacetoacetate hydrolase family protein [Planctomycetota bacterium]MDF1742531.1 fumarylacetoacetate hydrolase family protein [Gimesia sp.]
MRLCRYQYENKISCGFYSEDKILPLAAAAEMAGVELDEQGGLIPFLPGGAQRDDCLNVEKQLKQAMDEELFPISVMTDEVQLLVPIPAPSKLMLLAGNYSKHIEEGGGKAEERQKTFPYVFMKPPLTTLTHPGHPVVIPEVSPDHIDWELELGIVIGKTCKGVSEAEALNYVAGYTVINDISDRKFRPNPGRTEREKDGFFDWLHGKWHDTFCPMGPCITSSDEIQDPQTLKMKLSVNGNVEQDASTAEMIFPVAAIIEFISSYVRLEPGDVIATGTPSGVGASKNKFLKHGDELKAEIENIGVLQNPVD